MKKITLLVLATVVATTAFASSYSSSVKYLSGDGRVTGNNKVSLAGGLSYDATDTVTVGTTASVDMFSSDLGLWGFGNCKAAEGISNTDLDLSKIKLSKDCSTSATSYKAGLDIKFANDMMTLQTQPMYEGGDSTDDFNIVRGNTQKPKRSAWAVLNYAMYNVNENVMVAAIADFYSVENLTGENPADSKDDYTLDPGRYSAYGLNLVDETNYAMVLGGYGGFTNDMMDLKAGLLFMQDTNADAENIAIAVSDGGLGDDKPSVEHAEDSLINVFGRGEYKVADALSVYSGVGVGIPQSKVKNYNKVFGTELYVELGAKGTF